MSESTFGNESTFGKLPNEMGVINGRGRSVVFAALATLAGTVVNGSEASEGSVYRHNWVEAAARQAQAAQQRQRGARLRWEYERRRSAAHARMPNTLYASTPSLQPHADLSCPVLADENNREIYRRVLAQQGGSSKVLSARGMASRKNTRNTGINVFAAGGRDREDTSSLRSPSSANDSSFGHPAQASAWGSISAKSTSESVQIVYLFPSASEPLREGFVRVINHSPDAGEVTIDPTDDSGRSFDAITLSIDANQTKHFNSGDLENGNEGKGLTGSTGSGQGDWRLAFSSDLDVEVLSYIRTEDGFLTAMHDVAPEEEDGSWRIAIFNPGSNKNQVSRLRLINPGEETAAIAIRGTDDHGNASGEVTLSLDAGVAREVSAEELEMGAIDLQGMLGDGAGKWRLEVESDQPVVAMSLLESPTDHLTNLSTVPKVPEDGVYTVPLFPAAGDASGRQGFVRVINSSESPGEAIIQAYDESERDYEPITLKIGANEVVHFNSDDLEQGSTGKGLSGGTGAGEGYWRLEFSSDLDIELLSYIRTEDGFLTAMHDVAPSAGTRHRVAVFNPGSNRNQESLLRLINPEDQAAEITIQGIDDRGTPGEDEVSLTLTAGESRTVEAWELESGTDGLTGKLGDGSGKWQLMVSSGQPVMAMSLLRSPTGHMTNLSTAPVRGARVGATQIQTTEEVFKQLISGPVVQSKCIACHVEGGASGNTRLVFVPDSDSDHEATNLQAFRDFLDEVDDGAGYILNKIQGALGHGGGIQVAAGTEDYANMERFLGLLGEDVSPVAITPNTLFDGVTMESARSTLRRAAIVFAGRIPTDAEYDSIRTGGLTSLRSAIRGLMQGPAFHEFLIRSGNDRLLTDRDESVIDGTATDDFVDFSNLYYDVVRDYYDSSSGPEPWQWYQRVQYGLRRAPLELIAYVAEKDLSYTEILTADYIMANPLAAAAYGAPTEFIDSDDDHEFQPSKIVSYYRDNDSKVSEFFTSAQLGTQAMLVSDPGDLATDYPHAGVLNTTVFLLRYPTTATNRNRARSRWTYYHFLGLDIEKSASRTTDPVALADTNNPTLYNPACTVCHSVLDPVAGAFQNYGDVGFYRDQWGGFDSLDSGYKNAEGNAQPVRAISWEQREPVSWPVSFQAGTTTVRVSYTNDFYDNETEEEGRVYLDRLAVIDDSGERVFEVEFEDLGPPYNEPNEHYCGGVRYNPETNEDDHLDLWNGGPDCVFFIDLKVPADGTYNIEILAWAERFNQFGPDGMARIAVDKNPYRSGDTWYRDMREPGFNGQYAPNAETSVQWLAKQIVDDPRFAEAAVQFWWPAIMGTEVAEPPSEGDADFDGRLLASNAQNAEIARLANGFRQGFRGGKAYNLKDLLVEIVLSKWFRAHSMTGDDPDRVVALASAGANRLLTPEELFRKTLALTGFGWQRWKQGPNADPAEVVNWTNVVYQYGLLYGGIDSDGITERGRDFTSIMAGVAQRHAAAVSCPVVMKDLYLVDESDRRVFSGVDRNVTPAFEFGRSFSIEATSPADAERLSVRGRLSAGPNEVLLNYVNDYADEDEDRQMRLDRLEVRDGSGEIVDTHELEDRPAVDDCNYPVGDHFALHCNGTLRVPIDIASDGEHLIDVIVWGDQAGDELPELRVSVESDSERSAGSLAIRSKLAELHEKLLGVQVAADSTDLASAYELFVDVWQRNRNSDEPSFRSVRCDEFGDQHYFEGIVDEIWRDELDENGDPLGWDWELRDNYFETIDWSDPDYVARTWIVMLAYLMTDPRYLHL